MDHGNATHLDPISSSWRPLLAVRVWTVGEQTLQELVLAGADEVQKILEQQILVLIRHARHVIHHVACVVLDEELSTTSFEVCVG